MELITQIVAFFVIAVALYIVSGLDEYILARQQIKAWKREQRTQILGKKIGRWTKMVSSEQKLISSTKTNTTTYTALMGTAIGLGWLFGKMVFSDDLLAVLVAIMCVVLPHAFLILKMNRDKRERAEMLESAMQTITHEYINIHDIERSIENSIEVIDYKKPFEEFLIDMKMVSSNVERNLRRMEMKESNSFYSKWIDQLILVQTDSSQDVNLLPILDEMNAAKNAQLQCDTKIASAWREYFTMTAIILVSPLLVRFIQYEWYVTLVTTFIGKILIVAMLLSLVWATSRALKINKPVVG